MAEKHGQRMASWARAGRTGAEPVPAATVILVRDGPEGLETLMLRRSSKLAFVGGMWVFPGGRVDACDCEGLDPDDELGAARCAAVRESAEEAGLTVDAESLVPFSHWSPPPITPNLFLTWFFIAPAPPGAVTIDRGEIRDHAWMRPAEALRRRDAQEIELAPPTIVTLHELAGWADTDQAVAAARAREPERFSTRVAMVEGGVVALWHGDAGYEESAADRAGPRHRLSMLDSGWRYERTD
ncbi:MAG: NUDIX hydrolase [Planctomycetota bacterium]|jgi:8-oxo-dGTP pyrophosphatase MutT (NUDIX family)